MTSPLSKPPMLVTGKHLDRILDTRDDTMVATIDKFKVEVVERLAAMETLQDQMQQLMIQAMACIKLQNLIQPEAESVEVTHYIEDKGFLYPTTPERAQEARQAGKDVYRDTVYREKFTADPQKVREAEDVVAQITQRVA